MQAGVEASGRFLLITVAGESRSVCGFCPFLEEARVQYNVLPVAKIMKATPGSFVLYKTDLTTLSLDLYFSRKWKAFIK